MTTVSAYVSRAQLGLGNLDINSGSPYKMSIPILGGNVSWRKEQVRSPYVEGQYTTNRVRDLVDQPFTIDVISASQSALQTDMATLVQAFTQDSFQITVSLDSNPWTYQCEAADYQMNWDRERILYPWVQITFRVPTQPIPVAGPI